MKIIQDQTQNTIYSAVNKLVDLVKPTFGPTGNKVIIGKGFAASALDDGVQIAKDLQLEDEAENYVLKLIKEVAIKTNERVGDGTTCSLIMLQAIMQQIAEVSNRNKREVIKELKTGLEEAVKQLRNQSRPIKSKADLEKIARISFDNPEIAKLLAEIVYKIGGDGLIDVETSQGLHVESEMTDGFRIGNGFISPYMVTDRDQCVIENPYILVSDSNFLNNKDIVPVMEKVLAERGNSLVVLCKEFEGEALNTVILNKLQGKFKTLVVKIYEDHEDIALLTGANAIMAEKGKKDIEVNDLGRAKKIISTKDETVIIGGKGNKSAIKTKVEELKNEINKISDLKVKEKENARLARLTNAVAVIRVGATTEGEANALKYKIEDASNAVRVAFNGGVVKGAGYTLADLKTSSSILNNALKYPKAQLVKNMGEFEMTDDIIDPVEVLIAGLESAVSIAILLSTTTGIIYEITKKE